jgi:hypothetical protein
MTMNITNGRIAAAYSEINTGAWLVDTGGPDQVLFWARLYVKATALL